MKKGGCKSGTTKRATSNANVLRMLKTIPHLDITRIMKIAIKKEWQKHLGSPQHLGNKHVHNVHLWMFSKLKLNDENWIWKVTILER